MQHIANLRPPLGASYMGKDCYHFHLWAPRVENVKLRLLDPRERVVEMEAVGNGFYQARVEGIAPGTRYFYRLNNVVDRPDPTSRCQPEGVHGPSQLIDPHFAWEDSVWAGIPLQHYIFYEVHVGTFSEEGTFAAIRVEEPDVFAATHALAFRLLAEGKATGLRIDHPDGLYDPVTYFCRLQQHFLYAKLPTTTLPTEMMAEGEEVSTVVGEWLPQ